MELCGVPAISHDVGRFCTPDPRRLVSRDRSESPVFPSFETPEAGPFFAMRLLLCLSNAVVFIRHTARRSDYRLTRRAGSQSVSPATSVTDVATGKGVAPAAHQMLSSLFATPLVAPIIDRLVALILNPSLPLPASLMWLLGRASLLLLVKRCRLFVTRLVALIIDRLVTLILDPSLLLPASLM
eukprot:scaffold30096_cov37-Attheya_sp.AAC.3